MQRLCNNTTTRRFLSLRGRFRCFSQAAETTLVQENADLLPKMPPFNYTPPPYQGPSMAKILEKRKEFLSPSMFHFYKKPLNVVDGKMQYLFDEDGRRYLDAFGGIATVCCGHCHPDVVEAIVNQTKLRSQLEKLKNPFVFHPVSANFRSLLFHYGISQALFCYFSSRSCTSCRCSFGPGACSCAGSGRIELCHAGSQCHCR